MLGHTCLHGSRDHTGSDSAWDAGVPANLSSVRYNFVSHKMFYTWHDRVLGSLENAKLTMMVSALRMVSMTIERFAILIGQRISPIYTKSNQQSHMIVLALNICR